MRRRISKISVAPTAAAPIAGENEQPATQAENRPALQQPGLALPHERDQSTLRKGHPTDKVIEQAEQDVAAGQQDTDLRGTAAAVFNRRWTRRGTTRH
jgi:hypothetical protein